LHQWQILPNFTPITKFRNIDSLQGYISCTIYTKFAEFVPAFQNALAVKIWMDLLKGLWSYEGFKLRGWVPPHFQHLLSAELSIGPQTFSRCKNGWMDQNATWYGGKPQPRRRCVRWRRSSPPLKGAQPPVFGSCLLWQNGWMDEGATLYGSRPRPAQATLCWTGSVKIQQMLNL